MPALCGIFPRKEVSNAFGVVSIAVTLLRWLVSISSHYLWARARQPILSVCNGMYVTRGVMSDRPILPFSLVFDTLLLPIDTHHGPYE